MPIYYQVAVVITVFIIFFIEAIKSPFGWDKALPLMIRSIVVCLVIITICIYIDNHCI